MPDAKEVLEHLEKQPKFKVGDRVFSEKFGTGTVLDTKCFGNYPVYVIFDEVGDVPFYMRYTIEGHYYCDEKAYEVYAESHSDVDICKVDNASVEKEEEVINPINPSHYRAEGIPEAIEIMRGLMTDEQLEGFLWGNIIKYAYRYGRKGDTQGAKTETAAKIKWYADAMIGYLSGH